PDSGADLRKAPADRAQADNAKRLPVHLDSPAARPVPLANLSVGGRNVPGRSQQQRQTMLSDRDGGHARRIGDGDTVTRSRGKVDVIGPCSPKREQLELLALGEDILREPAR